MELSREEVNKIIKRIQAVKVGLMNTHPFFAVLLMHTSFALDDYSPTAYTDGSTICLNPDFVSQLNNDELTFILLHEVMHIALNHCNRRIKGVDNNIQNIACDIVVNSNILYSFNMDKSKITLKDYGESMHVTPSGREGYQLTFEEVIEELNLHKKEIPSCGCENKSDSGSGESGNKKEQSDSQNKNNCENNPQTPGDRGGNGPQESFDDHTMWPNDGSSNEEWKQIMVEANEFDKQISKLKGQESSSISKMLEREIEKYKDPQINWREVLQDFLTDEVNDYSFNPPDKRMQDSPFILPDFNDRDINIKNIWFVVDTSGSITDKELSAAYYEIISAIEQFDGLLNAKISYFDSNITEPVSFSTIDEFKIHTVLGGGGTDFSLIFDYLHKNMMDEPPSSIVILTDGCAIYPEEKEGNDIPVLWIINNEDIDPPWGKIARIKVDE